MGGGWGGGWGGARTRQRAGYQNIGATPRHRVVTAITPHRVIAATPQSPVLVDNYSCFFWGGGLAPRDLIFYLRCVTYARSCAPRAGRLSKMPSAAACFRWWTSLPRPPAPAASAAATAAEDITRLRRALTAGGGAKPTAVLATAASVIVSAEAELTALRLGVACCLPRRRC